MSDQKDKNDAEGAQTGLVRLMQFLEVKQVEKQGPSFDIEDFVGTDSYRCAQHVFRHIGGKERIRFWKGSWWSWDGSRFVEEADSDFRAKMRKVLQTHYRNNVRTKKGEIPKLSNYAVENLIGAMEAETLVPHVVEMPMWLDAGGRPCDLHRDTYGYVALDNGILGLGAALRGDFALEPLSPSWFSQITLPYAFDPDATCDRWLSFLDEFMQGDSERIALLQEFVGHCLVPITRFGRFLVLEGSGANGKSVFLSVVQHLVGLQNVSHLELERFDDDMSRAAMIGKLVNIVNEAQHVPKGATAFVKQIVTGERVSINRKYKPIIEVWLPTRLMIATNASLDFDDKTDGIHRRMILMPCRAKIPVERQDAYLVDKLLDELPGIFNWGLIGLGRLLERGRFDVPAACEAAATTRRLETNSARRFLNEHFEKGNGDIDCTALYSQYRTFCEREGEKPVALTQLGKEVKEVFGVERKKRGSGNPRPWFYQGLVPAPFAETENHSVEAAVHRLLNVLPSKD